MSLARRFIKEGPGAERNRNFKRSLPPNDVGSTDAHRTLRFRRKCLFLMPKMAGQKLSEETVELLAKSYCMKWNHLHNALSGSDFCWAIIARFRPWQAEFRNSGMNPGTGPRFRNGFQSSELQRKRFASPAAGRSPATVRQTVLNWIFQADLGRAH